MMPAVGDIERRGMNLLRRTLICTSAAALSATSLVVGAGPASAVHVACGQTIMVSTTLDSNVGPCATGLTIGANNVVLDLAGFTVSGTPNTGEGPGILIADRTGVTVKNGTVSAFDTGISIEGGSGNTVSNMNISGNRGAGDYGEGVLLFSTTGNTVTGNRITNNGPYGGISALVGTNNLIENNQIVGNNMSTTNTSGIRLENSGRSASNGNTIRGNLVQGSGLDGIQIFAGGSDNVISRNTVLNNNRDGITAFAGSNRNIIEDNQVRFNGFGPINGSGIYIRAAAGSFTAPAGNIIRRNVAGGNLVLDLRDGQPTCGTNVWTANTAVTGNPPCVFG
ncbi:MAG TPA: right-handed parallel beta-helix repeat-containing protein [Acidimicrobiales bacterium]|nr:right-handed parallel beta-helix repeat-containing protein [Acidimicrobiales bacterium]